MGDSLTVVSKWCVAASHRRPTVATCTELWCNNNINNNNSNKSVQITFLPRRYVCGRK